MELGFQTQSIRKRRRGAADAPRTAGARPDHERLRTNFHFFGSGQLTHGNRRAYSPNVFGRVSVKKRVTRLTFTAVSGFCIRKKLL